MENPQRAELDLAQTLHAQGFAESAQYYLDALVERLRPRERVKDPIALKLVAQAQHLYAQCCMCRPDMAERAVDRYELALKAYLLWLKSQVATSELQAKEAPKRTDQSSSSLDMDAYEMQLRQELVTLYLYTQKYQKAIQTAHLVCLSTRTGTVKLTVSYGQAQQISTHQRKLSVWRCMAQSAESVSPPDRKLARACYLHITRHLPNAIEAAVGYLRNGGAAAQVLATNADVNCPYLFTPALHIAVAEINNEYEKAIQCTHSLLHSMPNHPGLCAQLGSLLAKNGNPKSAYDVFNKIRRADRFVIEHMDTYVDVLRDLRERSLASEVAIDLHTIYPYRPETLTALAITRLIKGKEDNCVQLLNEAMKKSPHHFQSYITRGKMYMMTGKYPAAITLFRTLFQQGYKDVATLRCLIDALIYAKRPREMEPLIRTLAKSGQFNAEGLVLTGLIYRHAGGKWIDTAKTLFKQAMGLDPRLSRPAQELASIYDDEGDHDAAFATMEKALSNQDSEILRIHYGTLLFRQHQFKRALEQFSEARRIDPESIMAADLMAETECALKEGEQDKLHMGIGMMEGIM